MYLGDINKADTLRISMFGGIELSYGNNKIGENLNRSKKLWNLLAYIITHRNKNISQGEFIDVLWGQSECTNPENALKNLLYRVRNLLEPIKTMDKELILSSSNSYHWNNTLACTIDIEIFEHNIKLASNTSLDIETRICLYNEAIQLYKGSFLSNHSNELWVIPLSTHFHNLFLQAVISLAKLLENEHMYDEMLNICNYALQIDSLDEKLHILLIKAYLRQGNNKAALNHYKIASEILYKNLGVKPSPELKNLYHEIMKIQKELETNLSKIQSELKEHNDISGAFVCEYGFFQEAYRLESRHIERTRYSVFICLLTLNLPNGKLPSLDILNDAMESLLEVIVGCLRKSDIVSKYSKAQYVIMIPAKDYETCELIMNRIVNSYYSLNRKSFLRIKYNIEPLKSQLAVK